MARKLNALLKVAKRISGSSFLSHMGRKHSAEQAASAGGVSGDNTDNPDDGNGNDYGTDHAEFAEIGESFSNKEDGDVFLTNLALFYLRMQAKMLLPATTISALIEEFQAINSNGMAHILTIISQELEKLGIPRDRINEILDGLSKENLLKMHNEGVFRSDQTRKTFFKSNFSYVEPTQVYLGIDPNGKERFCQYVPVKDTLKALLSNPKVWEQYNATKMHSAGAAHVLEDVHDGKNCRENTLLQQAPSSVSIILYQDAFEVANPLGSGKKKHKLLAVYITLGEILPHNRSAIDPVQLVLLCREVDIRHFGQEKVFSTRDELKEIEESGITLNSGVTLQGAVIAIVGDNLGSHSIGGFTENFSSSKNFCRYCSIDKESFEREPTKLGPVRTKETYENCVEELSRGQEFMIEGVKFDSVFNKLKHFHVCQPGLPPCLGHDLFEGIVSNDLALYIENLVSVGKHFSYTQLNRSISNLKLQGSDASNRPCDVRPKGQKLGGSAAQNWCLLRLLPILIGDRIKNPLEDQVWLLCLKLREIVELICAPKIHANQVAYLNILIREYLDSRVSLFPDKSAKPKHHYLLHYPDLILKFGPLIRLWTLRFESKHTYFKQCARKLRNFKSLGSTLAERHQLLQAYLHSGNIFAPVLQIDKANAFDSQIYNAAIQQAVTCRG